MDSETLKGVVLIIGYILILGGVPVFLTRKKDRCLLTPFLLGIGLGPIGWIIAWKAKPKPSAAEEERMRKEHEERMRNRPATTGNEWFQ
jgi:hypothetical protein